jgi:D-sedoheptulose 7-phosphate isomerase
MQFEKNDIPPLPDTIQVILENVFTRYPSLVSAREGLARTYHAIVSVFEQHGMLYLCGNGGSFADAMHIKGELAKSFEISRPIHDPELISRLNQSEMGKRLLANLECGFPVIVLGESHSLRSAYENDRDPVLAYAQELYSFAWLHNQNQPAHAGNARDSNCVGMAPMPGVLLGISTSGNAENVIAAMTLAKEKQITTISFTGPAGGALTEMADIDWRVPGGTTAEIQENQAPLYHTLCRMMETRFFNETP